MISEYICKYIRNYYYDDIISYLLDNDNGDGKFA